MSSINLVLWKLVSGQICPSFLYLGVIASNKGSRQVMLHNNDIDYNKIGLLREACAVTRKLIKESSTFPNIDLTTPYYRKLDEEITKTMREESSDKAKALADQFPPYDFYYATFLATLQIVQKYQKGNCQEMALETLNYLLHHPEMANVSMEVYQIKGGDHVFLVINRDPTSLSIDFKNWGDGCVIADPWASENNVYFANEIPTYLKVLNRVGHENVVEDFVPLKHLLVPITNMNAEYLLKAEAIHIIKQQFIKEASEVQVQLTNKIIEYTQKQEEIDIDAHPGNKDRHNLYTKKIQELERAYQDNYQIMHNVAKHKSNDMEQLQKYCDAEKVKIQNTLKKIEFSPIQHGFFTAAPALTFKVYMQSLSEKKTKKPSF